MAVFLGLVLLFGCVGQTATTQSSGQGTSSATSNPPAAQENYTAELWSAVLNNNTALAESLVNKGANVNFSSRDPNVSSQMSLIGYSSKYGYYDLVKLLINRGADINDKNNFWGMTPLMFAIDSQHFEIAEFLMQRGADVNIRDREYGMTALMYSINTITPKYIVENLIRNGANVTAKSNDGWDSLRRASLSERSDLIDLLIANGAIKNQELSYAIGTKNITLVENAINNGANVNEKDNINMTFLMRMAERGGQTDIAKLLIDKGADVNAKDVTGETALMYAAGRGDDELVKILVENGADVNAKDNEGKTALKYSEQSGNIDTINILKQAGATE